MIIKKKNFNLTPGYRGKWPFTVPEVAIMKMTVGGESGKLDAFAVIHNFSAFALSGILESYGFHKLGMSGIWADELIMGETVKKSLTPFFEYLEKKAKG
jgi:hypothetical protein